MKLSILTPGKTVYEGNASSIIAPGKIGGLQILENHAPLVTSLGEGTITIVTDDSKSLSFETTGNGFMEVLSNNVSVLLESVKK